MIKKSSKFVQYHFDATMYKSSIAWTVGTPFSQTCANQCKPEGSDWTFVTLNLTCLDLLVLTLPLPYMGIGFGVTMIMMEGANPEGVG